MALRERSTIPKQFHRSQKLKVNQLRILNLFIAVLGLLSALAFFSSSITLPLESDRSGNAENLEISLLTQLSEFIKPHTELDSDIVHRSLINIYSQPFPVSISSNFARLQKKSCGNFKPTPFVPALRAAFAEYGLSVHDNPLKLISQQRSTLTIQIDTRNNYSSVSAIDDLRKALPGFSDVLLVPMTPKLSSSHAVVSKLSTQLSKTHHVYINKDQNPDDIYYLLSQASNIFPSGGVQGALATLSNSNGIIYQSFGISEYLRNDEFRWMVRLPPKTEESRREKMRREMFQSITNITPTCCKFEGFGSGDQEKIVCSNSRSLSQEACWVLSLGCNNKWEFEEDIFKKTNCVTHVFDCTGEFEVPELIRHRVFLHDLCVGPNSDSLKYRSFKELIKLGSLKSGFPTVTAPVIAKVDVEGWEIPSLRRFLSDQSNYGMLPHQLLMEMHASVPARILFAGISTSLVGQRRNYENRTKIFDEFFLNMSRSGYDIVHRADNPYCTLCTETNFLLRDLAPRVSKFYL